MLNKTLVVCVLHLVVVLGSLSVRPNGWLDRVVQFFKNDFIDDFLKLSHVNIKASIEEAEPGYVDSSDWDYPSVVRLLVLLRKSDGNEDVCRALRRSIKPTRRFMSYSQSFKAFPSLTKDNENEFYYDFESDESYIQPKPIIKDKSIIHIKNPVEARLPSAHISVDLLRSILENRAKANRYMPSTSKKTTSRTTTTTTKCITTEITTPGNETTSASNTTATDSSGKTEVTTLAPSNNSTDTVHTTEKSDNNTVETTAKGE